MPSSQAVAVFDLNAPIRATCNVVDACYAWRNERAYISRGDAVHPAEVYMTPEAHQALLDELSPMLVQGFHGSTATPHGRILGMDIHLSD